ncbi:MAG: Ig-like domain-containing domain [Bacteroidota bacterium]|nr:Ig-like domain-containing domain [Bacteroidota bacterium]
MTMVLLLIGGCASQRPPEGGPVDTEAPFIIESDPPSGSTRYKGQEVTLEFNEYVRRQTFQEAVHISPLPSLPPVYEWSGKDVTIMFQDTLQPERTYVITVGTKVRDANAGNAMAETFHLAFSTGDSLDRGTFAGIILDENPSGVSIFAYLLPSDGADTLDPAADRPDYLVMSADDGTFRFYNVTPGNYRVFAVRDQINNVRYDVETDAIGIPYGDITVRDSIPPEPPLRFRLFKEDTTRPSVQRIEPLNTRRLRIKFNETVYPQPLPLHFLHLIDSATAERIPFIDVLAPPGERYAWDLFTRRPLPAGTLLLRVDSLVDGARNPLALPDSALTFSGTAEEDTTRPTITSRFPTPRARNVAPDSAFVLLFDRPMTRGASLQLTDSTGAEVSLDIVWLSTTELRCVHPVLMDEAAYTLCSDLASLKDSVYGRPVADSTYCLTFITGIQDRFGTVSGSIRTDDSSASHVVRLREAKKDGEQREVRADSSGTYTFPRVPEGRYLLDAYQDRNANERFDPGAAQPFTPPEPFGVLRDTLRVRARWETNGVIIPVRP